LLIYISASDEMRLFGGFVGIAIILVRRLLMDISAAGKTPAF
jgi:hypothetical protein